VTEEVELVNPDAAAARLSSPLPAIFLANPFRHQWPVLENHAFGTQGKSTTTVLLEPKEPSAPTEWEEDMPQIQFIAKPFHANADLFTPHRLRCGVMHYAWGHRHPHSAVAQWRAVGDPDFAAEDKPYAELWVGTHVSAPSVTYSGEVLSAFLQRHVPLLGETHVRHFGPDLPYLLKILSIRTALSIQAHPDRTLAGYLHRTAPEHYPDPNHKPEAVVALTQFKALCSFRPLDQIADHLRAVPELRALVEGPPLQTLLAVAADGSAADADRKAALKAVYVRVLECPSETAAHLLVDLERRLRCRGSCLTVAESTFLDLLEQYPGDAGCFHVFFLNIITLSPGEGLFLAANEPHAYLHGDAVEVMARCDNVVRAGLTPKFKDVRVLGEMLSYDTQDVHVFLPNTKGPFTSYCPPPEYPDFKLLRIHLSHDHEWPYASYELADSSACLLCVKGAAEVLYCVRKCANPPQRLRLEEGSAYFLPANIVLYFSMEREFVAFIAEAQLPITQPQP